MVQVRHKSCTTGIKSHTHLDNHRVHDNNKQKSYTISVNPTWIQPHRFLALLRYSHRVKTNSLFHQWKQNRIYMQEQSEEERTVISRDGWNFIPIFTSVHFSGKRESDKEQTSPSSLPRRRASRSVCSNFQTISSTITELQLQSGISYYPSKQKKQNHDIFEEQPR